MDYDDMDEPILLTANGGRKRRPQNSARYKAKGNKYGGNDLVGSIACTHNNASCAAVTLTEADVSYIKEQLYCSSDKVKQDAILLSHMDVMPCKRRRRQVDTVEKRRQRDVTIKYRVVKEDKTKVPVCQSSFLGIFCIKKDRVQGIAKYWLQTGKARPENRGGSRETDDLIAKKQMVRGHIQSFTCRSSRYAQCATPGRKFLPSDLSVAKMHRMFLEQNHQQVSYSLYWSIFVYDFNLAFGHPAKDVCSSCVKYRMAINDPDSTAEHKRNKILLYSLHRHRARQFYDTLNDVGDAFTVCFDMMENLLLPKSAMVQAYYSRQLYLYVFGVVRHHGRGEAQSRDDVHLYTWLEYENSKDSNVVASALQHYFTTVTRVDLQQCQSLRLFSDSCYCQNKNMNVLSMLFALRSQLFPQLSITCYFPIPGHSFLPADRVFGRIEQDIRKHTTILLPDEYSDILWRYGVVHQYGKDWHCYDFKKAAATLTRAQTSFKISDARVLQISGDTLGFKPVFAGQFCQHSVLKPDKEWSQFKPGPLPDVNCVKKAKKADVLKLLGELGVSTDVYVFYENVLSSVSDEDIEQDLEDGEDE